MFDTTLIHKLGNGQVAIGAGWIVSGWKVETGTVDAADTRAGLAAAFVFAVVAP